MSKKEKMVQINVSVPIVWKEQLGNIARVYSAEGGRTITMLELVRRGIQEKYQLPEDK